ncbi:hypothetical protein COO60DRAFT_1556610 [Scenedesmus sp. NREL 46B-D3]|nr:hypothetical protein COO60DRAFT_1556610 [Scenedesmus sp. NREL 46B-D3]
MRLGAPCCFIKAASRFFCINLVTLVLLCLETTRRTPSDAGGVSLVAAAVATARRNSLQEQPADSACRNSLQEQLAVNSRPGYIQVSW